MCLATKMNVLRKKFLLQFPDSNEKTHKCIIKHLRTVVSKGGVRDLSRFYLGNNAVSWGSVLGD
jgi:hypothetical protein